MITICFFGCTISCILLACLFHFFIKVPCQRENLQYCKELIEGSVFANAISNTSLVFKQEMWQEEEISHKFNEIGIRDEAYKVDMIVGDETYKAGFTILAEDTIVKYEHDLSNKTTPNCEV